MKLLLFQHMLKLLLSYRVAFMETSNKKKISKFHQITHALSSCTLVPNFTSFRSTEKTALQTCLETSLSLTTS